MNGAMSMIIPDDVALEGGPDDDLGDIYANPGELIELGDKDT
jgi:hypothetical protein